jgi:molybdenum cofactor biosynthesis enzyme MoaA
MNEASILPLARWERDEGLILRFIEYMDVGHSNGWRLDDVVPAEEILSTIDAELPLEPVAANYRGEVAGRYRFRGGDGELGVIASVSRPFCGDCTRARLSAEGHLYTCLFAVAGTDLKTPLRAGETDAELTARIEAIWGVRATATRSCAARRRSACRRWRCSPRGASPGRTGAVRARPPMLAASSPCPTRCARCDRRTTFTERPNSVLASDLDHLRADPC